MLSCIWASTDICTDAMVDADFLVSHRHDSLLKVLTADLTMAATYESTSPIRQPWCRGRAAPPFRVSPVRLERPERLAAVRAPAEAAGGLQKSTPNEVRNYIYN